LRNKGLCCWWIKALDCCDAAGGARMQG
jgi:hypothetical protein